MKPVKVLFTCDVECLLGNSGNASFPIYRPWPVETMIWGRIDGLDKEWGIPLLMDQLESRGMRGTFYVSALQRTFHGDEALAEVARSIENRGHEAGVHVHCAWKGFSQTGQYDRSKNLHKKDSINQHDETTQREVLKEAIDCLKKWVGKQPVSFRAGNFGANQTTLRILSQLGIKTDSSRNAATGSLNSLRIYNMAVNAEGILEIPVTTFEALRRPFRKLRFIDPSNITITEAKNIFEQIATMGIETLVLVTHSFQYIAPGHVSKPQLRPRRRIVERVDRILDILATDPRFESYTMRDLAFVEPNKESRKDGLPSIPWWMSAAGFIQSSCDGLPSIPILQKIQTRFSRNNK